MANDVKFLGRSIDEAGESHHLVCTSTGFVRNSYFALGNVVGRSSCFVGTSGLAWKLL
jgi:hypothetical protein